MLLMPYLPIFASWWVTAWRSRAFVLPEFFVFAAAAPSAAGPPEISLAAFAFSPVVRPAPPVVAALSSPNSLVCAGYFWCRRLLLICCRCFRCSTPLPPHAVCPLVRPTARIRPAVHARAWSGPPRLSPLSDLNHLLLASDPTNILSALSLRASNPLNFLSKHFLALPRRACASPHFPRNYSSYLPSKSPST